MSGHGMAPPLRSATSRSAPPGHVELDQLLHNACTVFAGELRAELVEAGFADIGPHFASVCRLLAVQPLILRELASALDRTPTGALQIVRDLEAKGYLERTPISADRRMRLIRLTGRAHEAMDILERFPGAFEERLARSAGAGRMADTRFVLEALLPRATLPKD